MKSQRFAWVWVYLGIVVVSIAVNGLADSPAPLGVAMGVSLVGGIALGAYWYRLYPRPLAKRLFGPVCFMLAFLGLAAFDFQAERFGPNLVLLGVLAGLVLAEEWPQRRTWRQQRDTALTSRQTLRELR